MEEKLTKLQAKIEGDQTFAEKLIALETPEEVQNLLKAEGLDFTFEDINMLREALLKTLSKGENGELSDADLEEVAGGFAVLTLIGVIAGCIGAACGAGNFVHNVTRGRW